MILLSCQTTASRRILRSGNHGTPDAPHQYSIQAHIRLRPRCGTSGSRNQDGMSQPCSLAAPPLSPWKRSAPSFPPPDPSQRRHRHTGKPQYPRTPPALLHSPDIPTRDRYSRLRHKARSPYPASARAPVSASGAQHGKCRSDPPGLSPRLSLCPVTPQSRPSLPLRSFPRSRSAGSILRMSEDQPHYSLRSQGQR